VQIVWLTQNFAPALPGCRKFWVTKILYADLLNTLRRLLSNVDQNLW